MRQAPIAIWALGFDHRIITSDRVGFRSLGANTLGHLSAMPPRHTALSGTIADVFQDPKATS
jgi:hypothetical protein